MVFIPKKAYKGQKLIATLIIKMAPKHNRIELINESSRKFVKDNSRATAPIINLIALSGLLIFFFMIFSLFWGYFIELGVQIYKINQKTNKKAIFFALSF